MNIYAEHAAQYFRMLWTPIPLNGKAPTAAGWTGRNQKPMDRENLEELTAQYPNHNIGLVLPRGVIGLDVDDYGDKPGRDTIEKLEEQLGVLPETWQTSSRDPEEASGIFLFRVPDEYEAVGGLPGVDTVQWFHRHITVWPSRHPDTGKTYEWRRTSQIGDVPAPHFADFPWLPEAWQKYLYKEPGKTTSLKPDDQYTEDLNQASTPGDPCPQVVSEWNRLQRRVSGGASRHDAILGFQISALKLGANGHQGVQKMLYCAQWWFCEDVQNRDAFAEWHRALRGAVDHIEISGSPHPCECTEHFDQLYADYQQQQDEAAIERMLQAEEDNPPDEMEPDFDDDTSDTDKNLRAEEMERNKRILDGAVRLAVGNLAATPEQVAEAKLREVGRLELKAQSRADYAQLNSLTTHEDDLKAACKQVASEDEYGINSGLWLGKVGFSGSLFYMKQTNLVFGESSVGKSLLAAKIVHEILIINQVVSDLALKMNVLYLEFDNNPATTLVRRLMHMGIKEETIVKHLSIVRSVAGIEALPADWREKICLVVLDAFNPAIAALGEEPNQPEGVDRVIQTFFTPFLHKATGLILDHSNHASKDRQSHSIRKKQAIQGASYMIKAENKENPKQWAAKLILDKDNLGFVPEKIAYMSVDSTVEDLSINFTRGKPQWLEDLREAKKAKAQQTQQTQRAQKTQAAFDVVQIVAGAADGGTAPVATGTVFMHAQEAFGWDKSRRVFQDWLDSAAEAGAIKKHPGKDRYRAAQWSLVDKPFDQA